jgi:hypothetical protein
MATPKKPTISAELLEALHYSSAEEAALDMLLLSARSRYAECMHEVKQFETKYLMDFASFQQMVETHSNTEDFEQEDDLMAWKFAQDAADYWRQASEELKRATGVGETIR